MESLQVGTKSKFTYALGAIAFGVKDNGFTTFLMIYYNQVLGLSAFYTGLAILIALVVDALSDPYVGHLSDHWKSRLGRRHPFMYGAIIPAALTYFYLWNVPDNLSGHALFGYLVLLAILVRLFITFFEVPNAAQIAELTREYDARTNLSSLRIGFSWLGGISMAVVAYVVYLVPTDQYPSGILNKEGYEAFALFAAGVMVFFMLISSVGTHHLISKLPQFKDTSEGANSSFWVSLGLLFANKSFRSLFICSLFSMMAFGVIITLQIYFATYLFDLSSTQVSYFPIVMLVAAFISLIFTPILARGREKKTVLKFLVLASILIANLAVLLKLLDWLPENGDPMLLPILLCHVLIATAVMVGQQSLMASMTADLVEETQRTTGQRLEGLYFAAGSFSRKIVSGLGIFASGVFLSSATGATGQMNAQVMETVAYYYVPFVALLYVGTYYFIKHYTLSRSDHEANLKSLGVVR